MPIQEKLVGYMLRCNMYCILHKPADLRPGEKADLMEIFSGRPALEWRDDDCATCGDTLGYVADRYYEKENGMIWLWSETSNVCISGETYRSEKEPQHSCGDFVNIYQLALDSQDACNSSGLVHSLSRCVSIIWNEARALENGIWYAPGARGRWRWRARLFVPLGVGGGTTYVNQHPVMILFLTQLCHLTKFANLPFESKDYREARVTCEKRAAMLQEYQERVEKKVESS